MNLRKKHDKQNPSKEKPEDVMDDFEVIDDYEDFPTTISPELRALMSESTSGDEMTGIRRVLEEMAEANGPAEDYVRFMDDVLGIIGRPSNDTDRSDE